MSDCTEQSHQPLLSYWMSPQPHWGSPEKCVCVCEEYNHSPLDTLKTQPDVTSLNHRETCVYTCWVLRVCVRVPFNVFLSSVSGRNRLYSQLGETRTGVCVCMYVHPYVSSLFSLLVLFTSLSGFIHRAGVTWLSRLESTVSQHKFLSQSILYDNGFISKLHHTSSLSQEPMSLQYFVGVRFKGGLKAESQVAWKWGKG